MGRRYDPHILASAATGPRYLRVYPGSDTYSQTYYTYFQEFSAYTSTDGTGTDLTTGKTATASSGHGLHPASHGIDDNTGTYFENTTYNAAQYWQVDLGAQFDVKSVAFAFGPWGGGFDVVGTFFVKGSVDGSAWVDLGSVYGVSNGGRQVFDLTAPIVFGRKGSDVVLSNGNATFTNSTSGSTHSAHTTGALDATGNWYWEFYVNNAAGQPMVGIMQTQNESAAALTNYPGSNASGYGYYSANGSKYNAGASSYGATYTTGDVIGFHMNAGTVTAYKNGVSQGTLASGLSGTWYPAVGRGGSGTTDTAQVTLRTAANTWTQTPPAGAVEIP